MKMKSTQKISRFLSTAIMTVVAIVCVMFTSMMTAPAAAGQTSSSDKRLSDYSNGLSLLNAAGWSFQPGYQLNLSNSSLWLNGSVCSSSTTMKVLQYGSDRRYLFMSVIGNKGEAEPGACMVTPTYGRNPYYSYVTIAGGWSTSSLQIDCPQSVSDLKIMADGYVYYPFYVRIGANKGRVINYYLTANGFSTSPSGGVTLNIQVSTPSVPGATGSGNFYTLEKTYTGSLIAPFPNVTGISWSGTTYAVNAGTYIAYATPQSGYSWSDGTKGAKMYQWTVSPISASSATVVLTPTSAEYTGSAVTPTPSVVLGGKTLTQGTDYTVTYTNNTDAGIAKAQITFKGNYTGTKSSEFI